MGDTAVDFVLLSEFKYKEEKKRGMQTLWVKWNDWNHKTLDGGYDVEEWVGWLI